MCRDFYTCVHGADNVQCLNHDFLSIGTRQSKFPNAWPPCWDYVTLSCHCVGTLGPWDSEGVREGAICSVRGAAEGLA